LKIGCGGMFHRYATWRKIHPKAKNKGVVFDVEIFTRMWLGFPIHKTITLERGKMPLK
jgi:hypothetical protein